MAYMTKDGKGPYPNKAGEYCGNHNPSGFQVSLLHESPAQVKERIAVWLSDKRLGQPHSCKAGTSDEMKAQGWFGVYLAEDSTGPRLEGEYDVPTPPELMESGAAT